MFSQAFVCSTFGGIKSHPPSPTRVKGQSPPLPSGSEVNHLPQPPPPPPHQHTYLNYRQWAGGTHPTGMHPCWQSFNYQNYLNKAFSLGKMCSVLVVTTPGYCEQMIYYRASTLSFSYDQHIFTVRKQSCGKVMFSQVWVSHYVHRGWGGLPFHMPWGRQTHPSIGTPVIRSTSKWYASYWNASLLCMNLLVVRVKVYLNAAFLIPCWLLTPLKWLNNTKGDGPIFFAVVKTDELKNVTYKET